VAVVEASHYSKVIIAGDEGSKPRESTRVVIDYSEVASASIVPLLWQRGQLTFFSQEPVVSPLFVDSFLLFCTLPKCQASAETTRNSSPNCLDERTFVSFAYVSYLVCYTSSVVFIHWLSEFSLLPGVVVPVPPLVIEGISWMSLVLPNARLEPS
jgi:hypothetical protein